MSVFVVREAPPWPKSSMTITITAFERSPDGGKAHEWICAFQAEGFALKLDDYIAKYPQHFGTIFPSLWESAKCPDGTYGIPNREPDSPDSRTRMLNISV
jgi:hypothetical protein